MGNNNMESNRTIIEMARVLSSKGHLLATLVWLAFLTMVIASALKEGVAATSWHFPVVAASAFAFALGWGWYQYRMLHLLRKVKASHDRS